MRTETGIKGSTDADHEGDGKRTDTLNETDAQTFRQAAGTGLYMSIDRPSLQFAMSVVMSGMSEPKVVHQLQVVRVAGRRDSKTSFLTRVNVWLKKTNARAHLHGSGAKCIHTFWKLRAMAVTMGALQHRFGEMHKIQSDSLANLMKHDVLAVLVGSGRRNSGLTDTRALAVPSRSKVTS